MSLATGVIHTLTGGNFWVWDEEGRPSQPLWPESSGGLDTLERIFERHRESQRPGFGREWPVLDVKSLKPYPSSTHHEPFVDLVLHELLLPERNRQQQEMIEAMKRVCDLIERARHHE